MKRAALIFAAIGVAALIASQALPRRAAAAGPVRAAPETASGETGGAPTVASPAPEETPVAPAASGSVRIDVEVDRSTVTLGDPITVTLRLVHPKETRITSFDPAASLGDLALLAPPVSTTATLHDGRLEERRVLRIARYRLGEARVPSFVAAFADPRGAEGKVATVPVPFRVGSILAEGDTRQADIKNPAFMPVRVIWPWLLLAAAVVAGIAAVWFWRRRARAAVPVSAAPAAPPRPAHEIAYAEMERLLSSGLLDQGRVKEFYIELAEIVRRYFEKRFGVDMFERTSAEILESLRLARLPVRGLALTSEFFGACDLVKFAKYVPPADETRGTVERAYRLIDETRERPGAGVQETPAPARGPLAAGGTP